MQGPIRQGGVGDRIEGLGRIGSNTRFYALGSVACQAVDLLLAKVASTITPMNVRAIAFDVHGTLANWGPHRVTPIEVQRLLARYGYDISYQAYEAARQGVFFLDCPSRPIVGWGDYLALLFARMGVAISTDLLACLVDMHERRQGMTPYPDALPAIHAARDAGLRTCSFTTLPKFMVGPACSELISTLDLWCDAGLLGCCKGERRYYDAVTARLAVAPGEILAVGDDPLCDVTLPIEAGWCAVRLDRSASSRQAESAVPVITSLVELPARWSA